MFGSSDDERIIKEVAHVEEGVGADSFVSTQVLEGVTGMETVFGNFKLQTIAGGMQTATDAFGLP